MQAFNVSAPFRLPRRIPLARIDALVSAHLGPACVPGNAQPAVFNRQIAMYLASQVGGWSTTAIGRFYNGRDHSTVCYAIQRIKAFRQVNSEVDQLLMKLEKILQDPESFMADSLSIKRPASITLGKLSEDIFLDELASRIADRLLRLLGQAESSGRNFLAAEEAAVQAVTAQDIQTVMSAATNA